MDSLDESLNKEFYKGVINDTMNLAQGLLSTGSR